MWIAPFYVQSPSAQVWLLANTACQEKVERLERQLQDQQNPACEKYLKVRLSQTSLSLQHQMRDIMNATEFFIPVSCQYYASVELGQEILDRNKRFRGGSLIVSGSWSNWSLRVVGKQEKLD
jgi:hypothetical protein